MNDFLSNSKFHKIRKRCDLAERLFRIEKLKMKGFYPMKIKRNLIISVFLLLIIHIFAQLLIKNDGFDLYDYNKNVYIENIPKDYELVDDRIFAKEKNM